jgi:hypothetical protein
VLIAASEFSATPTSCQFAKGGEWERAWSFSLDSLPSDAAVRDYLSQSTEVAFEVFFGSAFFGARIVAQSSEVELFALKCLRALHDSRAQPFLAVLQEHLQLPRPESSVSFAEIGCVNAWRSVGTVRIPNPSEALSTFEETWRAVQRSAPFRDTRHRKAIEFAFEQPLPHWFGVPVSESEQPCRISKELLRNALRMVNVEIALGGCAQSAP